MYPQRAPPANRPPSNPHPRSCCTASADFARFAVRSNRRNPPSARHGAGHRIHGNHCSWPGHGHGCVGCRAFSSRRRTFDCAGTKTLSPLGHSWCRSVVRAAFPGHGSANRSCHWPRWCPADYTNRSAATIPCSIGSPISNWKREKGSVRIILITMEIALTYSNRPSICEWKYLKAAVACEFNTDGSIVGS